MLHTVLKIHMASIALLVIVLTVTALKLLDRKPVRGLAYTAVAIATIGIITEIIMAL